MCQFFSVFRKYFKITNFQGIKTKQQFNFAIFWVIFGFYGILILQFSLNTIFRGILISQFYQNTIFRIYVRKFPILQEFG